MVPATDIAGVILGSIGSSSDSIDFILLGRVELSFATAFADDKARSPEADEGLPIALESPVGIAEVIAALEAALEVGNSPVEDAAVGLPFCCCFAALVSTDRIGVDVSRGLDVGGGEPWRGSIA